MKKGTINFPFPFQDIDENYEFSNMEEAMSYLKKYGIAGRKFFIQDSKGLGKLYIYQGVELPPTIVEK